MFKIAKLQLNLNIRDIYSFNLIPAAQMMMSIELKISLPTFHNKKAF